MRQLSYSTQVFWYKITVFCSILLLTSWCVSCQSSPPEWPTEVWSILPSPKLLELGVVNKYYLHYTSTDKYQKSTDIQYSAYEVLDNAHFRVTIYGPDLEKIRRSTFLITSTGLSVTEEQFYLQGEAQETQLEAGEWLSFTADSTFYAVYIAYGDQASEYRQTQQQTTLRDTAWEGQAAKLAAYTSKRHISYTKEEDQEFVSSFTDYYVQGLGLVQRDYVHEEGTGRLELVGQMSTTDFAKLRERVPRRVGYIDPEKALDSYGYFHPCNENPDKIFDYYNGQVDAGFKTGKQGLEKALRSKIDKSLLYGESGYLTFRFVINCEGETGWFITEEADLNFSPGSFSRGTVQHVYDILKGLRNWQPAILNGEVVDAYTYITLKISNGELIEVLP